MNRILKRSYGLLLTLIMLMSMNLVVLAQGTTSIAVSKATIGVGDTTTVTVTASASGTVTIKYTASLMNLTDCSASGYTSEGNTVVFKGTTGDLTFKSTQAGTASIIVSSSSCSGSSTTIAISGDAAAAPAEEATASETPAEESSASEDSAPAEAPASTGTSVGSLNDQGGFDIDGVAYVVSERYSDAEIPAGFSKVTLKIGGGTYSELTNGTVTIIYLKPADNTQGSGVFYSYNEEAGTVAKFSMLGSSSFFVMVSAPDSMPNSAFFEVPLTTDAGEYTAYSVDGSDFYYVYGTDNKGTTGWFMYDGTYGTVSRADLAAFSTASSDSLDEEISDSEEDQEYDSAAVYKDKLKKLRRIISVLVILLVIIAFAIVNYVLKNRKSDDDDEENDDIFSKAVTKTANRLPRSIVFSDSSDDDEDEDEDEDDSDDDEDEQERKRNSGIDLMDLNDL